MRTLKKWSSIFLVVSCFISSTVMAEGYIGIKGAMIDVDNNAYNKDALNIGLLGGTDFMGSGNLTLSLEGELTITAMDGETSGGADWGMQTLGFFAAFRAGSDNYFKAKFGVHNSEVQVNNASADDTGTAWGVGAGFKLGGGGTLEIEYSMFEADGIPDFNMISVAYLF